MVTLQVTKVVQAFRQSKTPVLCASARGQGIPGFRVIGDRHASRLVLIDLRKATEAEVSRMEDGFCFPKRVDRDLVLYSKMRRTENGIYREFEREMGGLTWSHLRRSE